MAAFQRRHYLVLAALFASTRETCIEFEVEREETMPWDLAIAAMEQTLCDVLAGDNPRFDKDHFLMASRAYGED